MPKPCPLPAPAPLRILPLLLRAAAILALALPAAAIADPGDPPDPAPLQPQAADPGDAWAGPGAADAPPSPGLESSLRNKKVVLDWTVAESAPARFRILHDGRLIATRDGKRSVQGWIASVRVAGWPRGRYLVTAEAGAARSTRMLILR